MANKRYNMYLKTTARPHNTEYFSWIQDMKKLAFEKNDSSVTMDRTRSIRIIDQDGLDLFIEKEMAKK